MGSVEMNGKEELPPRAEMFSVGYNRRADEIAFGRDPTGERQGGWLVWMVDLLLLPVVVWQVLSEAVGGWKFSRGARKDTSRNDDVSQ